MRSFRHKLRDDAAHGPASARCDAGLWELLVPLSVGGQIAGHFLVAGSAEGSAPSQADNRARHLLARRGIDLPADELSRLRALAPTLAAERRAALGRLLHAGAERLARILTDRLATAPEGVPAFVEHACRLVHAEFAAPLRVPRMARRLGVSAAHFSRTFHRATGLRFVDYVARFRAERARAMLLEENAPPIAAIARACGFASLSQFNRVFRAHCGTTARHLRTRTLGGNPAAPTRSQA